MNKFDSPSPESIAILREKISCNISLDQLNIYVCVNLVRKINGVIQMINLYMNQTLLDALGYTKKEIEEMGDDFFNQVMFEEDFERERENFDYLIMHKTKNKPYPSSCRFKCKNGKTLELIGHLSLYEPCNGSPYLQIINNSILVRNDLKANNRILDFYKKKNKRINNEKYNDFTGAELKVANLLNKGLPAKEAGEKLGISQRTVESHRRNIYGKLGIHSIAELIIFMNNLD